MDTINQYLLTVKTIVSLALQDANIVLPLNVPNVLRDISYSKKLVMRLLVPQAHLDSKHPYT